MVKYFLPFLLFISFLVQGQIIQVSPAFPKVTDNVTVIYDAAQGNAALSGIAPPIYAHTGVITTASTTLKDWKHTQGNWGTADGHVLMTSLGNDKYSISFNIASFYGLTAADTVLSLVFVFRNTAGTIVGRDPNGGDLFYTVYDDSLHAGILNPSSKFAGAALNGTINLTAGASQSCSLSLYANGNLLSQVTGDTLNYRNFTFLHYGITTFNLVADNGIKTVLDSLQVFVNPTLTIQDPPAGTKEGINYLNDSTVILELLAPYKSFVYVMGDFNNWVADPSYFMNQATDAQHWWLQINHLTRQQEYAFQYVVDGAIRIGDPYCDKVLDPGKDYTIPSIVYPNLLPYPNGKTFNIASVLQTAQAPYVWQTTNYQRPDKHNLVVYELLVRDFVPLHYYDRLKDSLDYLQTLGINAIELMPVMEFEGNASWGYNPNYYLAPDKTYGVKNSLKSFIDECHRRGIAVLLDIAFNDAFGSCPMVMLYWDSVYQQPALNNPWFNQQPTHPYSVGYDFNHESPYTKKFLDRTTRYWLQEYHADGYRFDLTKGYTQNYTGNNVGAWGQYDASRVAILERMVDSIWAVDSTAICVFEHLADNSEEQVLANHGILLWGNINAAYNQATMGYATGADISSVSYQARGGWNNANLVSFMESHDEERLMVRDLLYGDSIGGYNVKSLNTALEREEAAGNVFFTVPGPKMLWEFGERGYDISINQFCRICPKPQHWEYMNNPNRRHLYKVWAALIHLKTTYAPFNTTNYWIDFGGLQKSIHLNHPTFNVVALSNFDVVAQNVNPTFQHNGWWYEYFSGDSMQVFNTTLPVRCQAGEYRLYTDVRLQTPDLTAIEDLTNSTDEQSLYPNPTSGRTTILFDNQKGNAVQLIVFDLNGKQVLSLPSEYYPAGSQVLNFSLPANIADGVYFYKLTVGNSIHYGKVVYSK